MHLRWTDYVNHLPDGESKNKMRNVLPEFGASVNDSIRSFVSRTLQADFLANLTDS